MDAAQIIKVGLVEDQFLFRKGMIALLEVWPDIEVVFESPDGHSVIERLREAEQVPDVMLVDISLSSKDQPTFNGLNVLQALVTHHPEMRVIMLSVHEEEYLIAQFIEQGAHGYLVKESDPQEVHEAILAVFAKGSYINALTLGAIQKRLGGKAKPPKVHQQLTKREVEVLQLICQEMTAEEISNKLFISVKTVNGHRNNLLQKTGARNKTGLVMYAVRNQLIDVV